MSIVVTRFNRISCQNGRICKRARHKTEAAVGAYHYIRCFAAGCPDGLACDRPTLWSWLCSPARYSAPVQMIMLEAFPVLPAGGVLRIAASHGWRALLIKSLMPFPIQWTQSSDYCSLARGANKPSSKKSTLPDSILYTAPMIRTLSRAASDRETSLRILPTECSTFRWQA